MNDTTAVTRGGAPRDARHPVLYGVPGAACRTRRPNPGGVMGSTPPTRRLDHRGSRREHPVRLNDANIRNEIHVTGLATASSMTPAGTCTTPPPPPTLDQASKLLSPPNFQAYTRRRHQLRHTRACRGYLLLPAMSLVFVKRFEGNSTKQGNKIDTMNLGRVSKHLLISKNPHATLHPRTLKTQTAGGRLVR